MEHNSRGTWRTGWGFILAAAGGAVGLGNIWRFPYIVGENGGGLFVLIYLGAVMLVGLPILIAEIVLGRASHKSPVGAYRELAGRRSPWTALGWLGPAAAFVLLSFYSVVGGWVLSYLWQALCGLGGDAGSLADNFASLQADAGQNLLWLAVFMGITGLVVWRGVQEGLELCAKILMPLLVVILLLLMIRGFMLPGFGRAMDFLFTIGDQGISARGLHEAIGQAFFTLSVGVGAMLTYGSYLEGEVHVGRTATAIALLDTFIAILACLVIFPIVFSYGLEPAEGPGLVFINIPIALSQMAGGSILTVIFFLCLFLAALTSSINMFELGVSYFIDERDWPRHKASIVFGICVALFSVPAALAGSCHVFGAGMEALVGINWFDLMVSLASNWMMPLGGLGLVIYCGWRMDKQLRWQQMQEDGRTFYRLWLFALRVPVPLAIIAVFARLAGLF